MSIALTVLGIKRDIVPHGSLIFSGVPAGSMTGGLVHFIVVSVPLTALRKLLKDSIEVVSQGGLSFTEI